MAKFIVVAATLAGAVLGTAIGAVAQGGYFPPAQTYRQPGNAHYQPYMVDALQALQHARGLLGSAPLDKGGHRIRALAAVDQAINETNAGIQYANTHG
ncbi:hypothetical protein KX816_00940 [Sphingosinicellaceae bacterium]|nr:hypothetical protein KX816_00940 [Sphingosinicellaceae bacterium]